MRHVDRLPLVLLVLSLTALSGCLSTGSTGKRVSPGPGAHTGNPALVWHRASDTAGNSIYRSDAGTLWVTRFDARDYRAIRQAMETATQQIEGYRILEPARHDTLTLSGRAYAHRLVRLVSIAPLAPGQPPSSRQRKRYENFLPAYPVTGGQHVLIEYLVSDDLDIRTFNQLQHMVEKLVSQP